MYIQVINFLGPIYKLVRANFVWAADMFPVLMKIGMGFITIAENPF